VTRRLIGLAVTIGLITALTNLGPTSTAADSFTGFVNATTAASNGRTDDAQRISRELSDRWNTTATAITSTWGELEAALRRHLP
jgi:hypothetical protein